MICSRYTPDNNDTSATPCHERHPGRTLICTRHSLFIISLTTHLPRDVQALAMAAKADVPETVVACRRKRQGRHRVSLIARYAWPNLRPKCPSEPRRGAQKRAGDGCGCRNCVIACVGVGAVDGCACGLHDSNGADDLTASMDGSNGCRQ